MIYILAWLLFTGLAIWIGTTKNRPVLGGVLGGALGIIGVIIIACIPKKQVQLPPPPAE